MIRRILSFLTFWAIIIITYVSVSAVLRFLLPPLHRK